MYCLYVYMISCSGCCLFLSSPYIQRRWYEVHGVSKLVIWCANQLIVFCECAGSDLKLWVLFPYTSHKIIVLQLAVWPLQLTSQRHRQPTWVVWPFCNSQASVTSDNQLGQFDRFATQKPASQQTNLRSFAVLQLTIQRHRQPTIAVSPFCNSQASVTDNQLLQFRRFATHKSQRHSKPTWAVWPFCNSQASVTANQPGQFGRFATFLWIASGNVYWSCSFAVLQFSDRTLRFECLSYVFPYTR